MEKIFLKNPSIDDAAALLIQLEPEDKVTIEDLRQMLVAISKDETIPPPVQELVVSCLEKVALIQSNQTSDPEAMIVECGHLIEDAMNVREEIETGKYKPQEASSNTQVNDGQKETSDWDMAPHPQQDEDSSNDGNEVGHWPEDADVEMIAAFINESGDLISSAESALLALETDPEDMDAVATVFRAFHTVKGTASFLDLDLISKMAHKAESLLSRIRDGEIRFAGGYPDLALRSIDMVKALLKGIQDALETGVLLKPPGYDNLMKILEDPEKAGITDSGDAFGSGPDQQDQIEPDETVSQTLIPQESVEQEQKQKQVTVEEPAARETQQKVAGDLKGLAPTRLEKNQAEIADHIQTQASHKVASEFLIHHKKPGNKRTKKTGTKPVVESSVRVPVDRLDRFIDLVGELVVAHSMVVQDEVVAAGKHYELYKKVNQTSKIVRELQNMSMSMRMIPLRGTFQKMARLVRDLSRKVGKSIQFQCLGEDTEIDRNMVDIINDPLVHMIRNAVDHGIEPPDVRIQKGKPEKGVIQLHAYHSAGNVVVEIKDDGVGLDRQKILKRARETGLVSDGASLTDRDVFNLIFEPGFSTSTIVSDLSGRGVGMDVVKKNIEMLRGQVEINSKPDEGSLFIIRLPLTLAIIDGMVVRVGSQKYVIPTISIVRSIQPKKQDLTTVMKRGEMILLQGKLIPLFRLANLFQLQDAETDPTRAIVVIVENDGRQAGLLIDELIGSQQIVIKTLGEIMKNISGISGSAIMPNGKVGLILDVGGIVRLANKV